MSVASVLKNAVFCLLLVSSSGHAQEPLSTDAVPGSTAGEQKEEVAELQPGIFVIGGTRNTGLDIVKRLRAKDENVTVLVRPTSDLSGLEPTGAQTQVGDAMDRSSLDAALGSGAFRAVVSTLGGKDANGDWVDAPGTKNAVDAAKAAGVSRFIMVSSIGAGDSYDAVPWYFRFFLRQVIKQKTIAEDYLIASGLDYTIIRPGGLTNDGETGKGYLSEDRNVMGWIARTELGRLVVATIDDPTSSNTIYAAVEAED